jgi:hypothetical protein
MSEGSVGPTGPTLLAEILEFNSEIVRGQHLSPLQFSPGPLAGLPAALRGGAATPSATGCSTATRTGTLPKRVIWHVRGKGRLRSKHLDESLIPALLVRIPAADANCTNHLVVHYDGQAAGHKIHMQVFTNDPGIECPEAVCCCVRRITQIEGRLRLQ